MKHATWILALALALPAEAESIVLWERPDGGVSVLNVNWSRRGKIDPDSPDVIVDPSESEADFLERMFIKHVRKRGFDPATIPHVRLDNSTLPDAYFHDAWRWNPATSTARIPRAGAEAWHLSRLKAWARRKREVWVRRWTERQAVGDTSGATAAQQVLQRLESVDATDVSTPSTLNELKNCIPNVLKEPDP